MSYLRRTFRRSTLPLLLVVCLAAITFSYAFADDVSRPLAATDVLGSPDAAVNGKFAVGSAAVGTKALTVTGVIDFLGAGTVHNYFTQGGGNNMQINTNVDEANAVGDAARSQWKMVMGSNLDQFSIRRSPPGGTYNEDALFWINGATGNVGIATVDTGNGAAIPFTFLARLHVETASGHGIIGVTTDTSNNATGVFGQSSATDGYGVQGVADATTGWARGVSGTSHGDSGAGVAGYAMGTSGIGIFGYSSASSGQTQGVHGHIASPDGVGVSGVAEANTGTALGVYGTSTSTSGTGVVGYASATTGSTYGVVGDTDSSQGVGVYGTYPGGPGWAGYFNGDFGVLGDTYLDGDLDLLGGSSLAVTGNGVFAGDLDVLGTLTKAAGAFRIDHPLDPDNQYLYHAFVESPDMKNLYDGVVTLDPSGAATIQLPAWFEALNMDFRYQLTPLGAAMPNLHVSREIEDNEFEISGGEPGGKVSWLVTGIRHDPYAEEHRIPVEQDKQETTLTAPGKSPADYGGNPVGSDGGWVVPAP